MYLLCSKTTIELKKCVKNSSLVPFPHVLLYSILIKYDAMFYPCFQIFIQWFKIFQTLDWKDKALK